VAHMGKPRSTTSNSWRHRFLSSVAVSDPGLSLLT
jgi:hypothetical protein